MRTIVAFLLVMSLSLPMVSCSWTDTTTPDTTPPASTQTETDVHTKTISLSYTILATLGESYDFTMKAVAAGQQQGLVTAEQREKINTLARIYYDSYQLAVTALETYKDAVLRSSDSTTTQLASIDLLSVMGATMTRMNTLIKEINALNLSINAK